MARSNLVQVKKNETVKWLHDLPKEELKVIDLAVEKRKSEKSSRVKKSRESGIEDKSCYKGI